MGKVNFDTAWKCLLGVLDSEVHHKPLSPTTQENCAVAARELREAQEEAKAHDTAKPDPGHQARRKKGHKAHPQGARKTLELHSGEKIRDLYEKVKPRGSYQILQPVFKYPRLNQSVDNILKNYFMETFRLTQKR